MLYALVGVAVALLLAPAREANGRAMIRIDGAGGFETTLPLDVDARVEVPGPLGDTVVVVAGGSVRVVSSPCRQQTCVRMGTADAPGEAIVCVPNRVVLRVEGEGYPDADAVTR